MLAIKHIAKGNFYRIYIKYDRTLYEFLFFSNFLMIHYLTLSIQNNKLFLNDAILVSLTRV